MRWIKVHENRLEEFERGFAAMVRKANRLGLPAPAYRVGDAEPVSGENETYHLFNVEVTGQAPVINGWALHSVIAHLEGENLFQRVGLDFPDAPLRFRNQPAWCEHCKTSRRRVDTFLIYNAEKAEFMQLGSSCVNDFTGSTNALAFWGYEAAFNSLMDDEWSEGGGTGMRRFLNVETFVALAAKAAVNYGWVSRAKAAESPSGFATADIALDAYFNPRHQIHSGYMKPAKAEDVEAALEWARGLGTSTNDYLYNLNTAVRLATVPTRFAGLLASLVPSYWREMERVARDAERANVSAHVGTVGKREIFTVKLVGKIPYESMYGSGVVAKFLDENGNELTWMTSATGTADDFPTGEFVTVKATVKGHDSYKGIAQTILSRVALHVPKAAKNKAASAQMELVA